MWTCQTNADGPHCMTLQLNKVVEILVQAKAEVNKRNKEGWTALHLAAQVGNERVVEILVGAKADPGIQNARGEIAIAVARRHKRNRVVAILERW